MFHPDPKEYKTGADVFYEHLDETRKRARLAIVQFKLWDGDSFHKDERMAKQIQRMETFSCKNQLCNLPHDLRRTYRLPPCMAFLKPTDRIQDPDSKMYSTGLHIPLCVVKDAWEPNQNRGMSIRRASIIDRSLSNETFEELFNTNILGGKELSFDDLMLSTNPSGYLIMTTRCKFNVKNSPKKILHIKKQKNQTRNQNRVAVEGGKTLLGAGPPKK